MYKIAHILLNEVASAEDDVSDDITVATGGKEQSQLKQISFKSLKSLLDCYLYTIAVLPGVVIAEIVCALSKQASARKRKRPMVHLPVRTIRREGIEAMIVVRRVKALSIAYS